MGNCGNCGHTHPASTTLGATRILASCDQCACTTFRHGRGSISPQRQQDEATVGAALVKENAALKEHVKTLREQRADALTVGTFSSEEFDNLRKDAAEARAELLRKSAEHARTVRQTAARTHTLQGAVEQAAKIAAALATITHGGYNAHTHAAVANGAQQLDELLQAALTA